MREVSTGNGSRMERVLQKSKLSLHRLSLACRVSKNVALSLQVLYISTVKRNSVRKEIFAAVVRVLDSCTTGTN